MVTTSDRAKLREQVATQLTYNHSKIDEKKAKAIAKKFIEAHLNPNKNPSFQPDLYETFKTIDVSLAKMSLKEIIA